MRDKPMILVGSPHFFQTRPLAWLHVKHQIHRPVGVPECSRCPSHMKTRPQASSSRLRLREPRKLEGAVEGVLLLKCSSTRTKMNHALIGQTRKNSSWGFESNKGTPIQTVCAGRTMSPNVLPKGGRQCAPRSASLQRTRSNEAPCRAKLATVPSPDKPLWLAPETRVAEVRNAQLAFSVRIQRSHQGCRGAK